MCGRFSLTATPDEVRALFGYLDQPNFPPRYNIAPTQPVGIVREDGTGRRFALVRWGLIPPWVKDPREFTLLINARSETVTEKASFRNAIRRRRCLVPASGFYEWRRTGKPDKQAFWVPPAKGGLVGFAGIWESWMGRDGEELETAAILTAPANATLAPIHHRMPVVIPPEEFGRWLDCSADSAEPVRDLLAAPADDVFAPVPVSDRVNKVANDDADLQSPVEDRRAPEPDEATEEAPKPKKTAGGQMDLF
ncbi:MAG: SOS response-associated peptidase [Rhodobiaceae bacterium]|nr:SOS response-associated peptidase [Rhodobiaceae bacterium]